MRFYIIVFLCIILSQLAWTNNKIKPYTITPLEGVRKIRKANPNIFKYISYKALMVLSRYIRNKSSLKGISPIKYLLGENDKWHKGIIKASVKGLINKDPRVRLFCMHLLFKMSIKREWIEKDILKTIENETVDHYYYFKNIYGNTQYQNIKDWLFLFLNIDNQLILLSPKPNSSTYKNSIGFDWINIYDAYKYELYINDILYYSGKDSFVKKVNLHNNKSSYSPYRWTVIAKDVNGKIIKSSYSLFDIKKLNKPNLIINQKNPPSFKWEKIKSITYYKLYIYKKGDKKHKLLYNGNKVYYNHKQPLAKGKYLCYIVAGNEDQTIKSAEVLLNIDKSKVMDKPLKPDKPKETDELYFDIDEFKKLEDDPLSESRLKEPKPDKAKPDKAKPDKAKPDKAKPDKAKPDKTKPDKTKPDKAKPDKAKPDKAKPDKTKPDKAKPDKAKPDKAKPDKTKPDKAKPDKAKPDKTKPDKAKPDKVDSIQ